MEIIKAYLKKLDLLKAAVADESCLPYDKELIRQAILEEILENPAGELRSHLEIAYVQLETFITSEEYRIVADFGKANRIAQQMADMGDPDSIIKSVGIMKKAKGDRALRIQEKISARMRRRLAQLQEICLGQCAAGVLEPSWGICC